MTNDLITRVARTLSWDRGAVARCSLPTLARLVADVDVMLRDELVLEEMRQRGVTFRDSETEIVKDGGL